MDSANKGATMRLNWESTDGRIFVAQVAPSKYVTRYVKPGTKTVMVYAVAGIGRFETLRDALEVLGVK